ncbi:MAG: hypothetical protein ACP5UQ_14280, partial [Anaerolineae bacterium]
MKAKAIASWPRAAVADPVVVHDLDIVQDPHDLSYKVPGLVTWITLALGVIGAWLFPRVVLTAATIVALYMLLRILIVLGFYIVGSVQCRRWARDPLAGAAKAPAGDGLRPEDVYHVVLIANYREPMEVLARTLEALAVQENAAERLIVVLA